MTDFFFFLPQMLHNPISHGLGMSPALAKSPDKYGKKKTRFFLFIVLTFEGKEKM